MAILEKEELEKRLREYYVSVCGERETDIWYEQPAANVWVFGREGRFISLKCHILTGEVTEYVEE